MSLGASPHFINLATKRQSGFVCSLLDANHDRWHISRDAHGELTYTTEVKPTLRYPVEGLLVIRQHPKRKLSVELISSKLKRPLTMSYGDDLNSIVDTLIQREHCIKLFDVLSQKLKPSHWESGIHVSGVTLVERYVQLSSQSSCYRQLIQSSIPSISAITPAEHMRRAYNGGLHVHEEAGKLPQLTAHLSYPRPMKVKFNSERLKPGLDRLTLRTLNMVIECNERHERDW